MIEYLLMGAVVLVLAWMWAWRGRLGRRVGGAFTAAGKGGQRLAPEPRADFFTPAASGVSTTRSSPRGLATLILLIYLRY